jgi:hypothetical protein
MSQSKLTQQQRELLSAWLDGETTPAEQAEVEKLLEREDAQAELLELRQVRELVAQHAAVSIPEDVSGRVLERVQGSTGTAAAPVHKLPTMSWRTPVYAVAAALMVAVGLMFGPAIIDRSGDSGDGSIARDVLPDAAAVSGPEAQPESDDVVMDELHTASTRDLSNLAESMRDEAEVEQLRRDMDEMDEAKDSAADGRLHEDEPEGGGVTPPAAPTSRSGRLGGDAETRPRGTVAPGGVRRPGRAAESDGDSSWTERREAEGARDPEDKPEADGESSRVGLGGGAGGGGAGLSRRQSGDASKEDSDAPKEEAGAPHGNDAGGGAYRRARGGSSGAAAGGAAGGAAGAAPQPEHEIVLTTENRITAQNELLWVAKLHGQAELKFEEEADGIDPDEAEASDEEKAKLADHIEIKVGESGVAALLEALKRISREQKLGELELPEVLAKQLDAREVPEEAPAEESTEQEGSRASDLVPRSDTEDDAHKADEAQVRIIIRFK